MNFVEFGKHITDVYRKTILSIEDPQKRAEALQPVWDYVDSLDIIDNSDEQGLKSVVNTMQAAKDQFTTLVRIPSQYLTYLANGQYRLRLFIILRKLKLWA